MRMSTRQLFNVIMADPTITEDCLFLDVIVPSAVCNDKCQTYQGHPTCSHNTTCK